MKRETDLRVIKTRESIDNAMMDLLKTKTVTDITVTELARRGRISKGTFYLHYCDIFDLYDSLVQRYLQNYFNDNDLFTMFFDKPEQFFRAFDRTVKAGNSQRMLLIKGGGRDLINGYLNVITGKLYETGRIRQTLKNDLLIRSYFAGVQNIASHYTSGVPDEANEVLTLELMHLLDLFE